MKKIVLVLFVLCAFEAHAQSLGGEIVRKKEKPTLRSAWSSTFADNHTHTKKTEYTITALRDFLDEIAEIRKCGYAVDNEENELGVRCVAVAIPDQYGKYRYAASVSAPINRMDDDTVKLTAKRLLELNEY